MLDALLPYLVDGGPWALVGLTVVALLRGWLIPAATHERIVAAEKRRGDEYREAWVATDARGDLLAEHQRELLEIGRTTTGALAAMQAVVRREAPA